MKLDITEQNFNNSKELWRKRGINTFDIPLNSTAFTVNGNDAVCTLSLPHEDLLYSDYSAIMYWIQGDDGTTRPESRAGFCVPSSYEMNIDLEDDTSVSPLVTSTISGDTKGLAELTIHCENSAALAAIVANPKAITFLRPMWYTGYASENELNPDVLTPENTLVVEEMTDILSMSDPTENDLMFLNGKKYLFTFDDEPFEWEYEEDVILSPSFFEIKQRTGTEDFSNGAIIPGSSIYRCGKSVFSQNSYFYAVMKRMNFSFGDSIGYAPDEIEDVLNGNVFEYFDDTEIINSIINYFDTDEMMNIHLRDNGMYLISNSLCFNKSNICLIGHGSEIRIMTESFPNGLNLFGNSTVANVRNIELCDLKMKGRAKYENGAVLFPDQGIHFNAYTEACIFPRNMTVYNVNMDGFSSGVHMNVKTWFRDTDMNWSFIDCNLSRTVFGYNFKYSKRVLISGGCVDNSLSYGEENHCFYINIGSSYITVENCTLKNSTGAAIHQMGGSKDYKMEHNRYYNLVIDNCFDGLVFGGYTLDAKAEHIRGKNIGNFLHLSTCGGVEVKDYIATPLSSSTITVGEGNEKHSYSNPEHFCFFILNGSFHALVENCVFGDAVCFPLNSEEQNENIYPACPKFIGSAIARNDYVSKDFENGWVSGGYAISNVVFRNCKFLQKNSDNPEEFNYIGPFKNYNKHCWSFLFDCCEFWAFRNSFNTNPLYYVQGNSYKPSEIILNNCKGYYIIQSNVSNENIPNVGYFFFYNGGVDFNITGDYSINTSFYVPESINSQNVIDDRG
ncbi:MAG: hypothetical protein UHL70_05555 [Acutalibacteraceae bacterium]|nr:hypothetical protein [Acutalibacteraceae bacterium]